MKNYVVLFPHHSYTAKNGPDLLSPLMIAGTDALPCCSNFKFALTRVAQWHAPAQWLRPYGTIVLGSLISAGPAHVGTKLVYLSRHLPSVWIVPVSSILCSLTLMPVGDTGTTPHSMHLKHRSCFPQATPIFLKPPVIQHRTLGQEASSSTSTRGPRSGPLTNHLYLPVRDGPWVWLKNTLPRQCQSKIGCHSIQYTHTNMFKLEYIPLPVIYLYWFVHFTYTYV